ncbi:MAG: hypothetical protein V1721_07765 [Pseudomonadota bacterium]
MTGTKDGIKAITFGCRLNTYETEVMKEHARKAGLDNVLIINTCAVTGDAAEVYRGEVEV